MVVRWQTSNTPTREPLGYLWPPLGQPDSPPQAVWACLDKVVRKVVERNTRPSTTKRAGSRKSQYSVILLQTLRSAA